MKEQVGLQEEGENEDVEKGIADRSKSLCDVMEAKNRLQLWELQVVTFVLNRKILWN